MSDFANPDIIDVDVVIRQINQAHRVLGDTTWWAGQLSYTNLTVLALAIEIERLRAENTTLRNGIAEHKWTVSPYLYPDEMVHEHDCRLWALIEEDDDCHFEHASTVIDGRRGTETTALIEEDTTMSDDTVTITIPRGTAEWLVNGFDNSPGLHSTVIVEACRVALWTPKVGDIVQIQVMEANSWIWIPGDPHGRYSLWCWVVVDVTDRHVVLRDTSNGDLRAALIEKIRLDERREPECGWDTRWWDRHKSDYLDGDHE